MRDRVFRNRLIRAAIATVVLTLLFFLLSLQRGRVHGERQSACALHLKAIGAALLQYSNDHRNWYPDSLTALRRDQNLPTSLFVSPSDVTATATTDATRFDSIRFDRPNGLQLRLHRRIQSPLDEQRER